MIVVPVAPTRIPKHSLQPAADRAAVTRAQRREQAEARHRQAGAERVHVDERAASHHQGADDDEGHRRDVRGRADRRSEAVGDPAADHASAPPEVQDRRQEDAQRDEPEPDELGVLLVLRLPLAPLRADARGQARLERALLPASRHATGLRRRRSASYAKASLSLRLWGRRFAGNVRGRSPRTPFGAWWAVAVNRGDGGAGGVAIAVKFGLRLARLRLL